jgi:hypothetical protein
VRHLAAPPRGGAYTDRPFGTVHISLQSESYRRAAGPLGAGEGRGALAQLGEHLLCKQGVVGSIPTGSTRGRTGTGSVAQVVRAHA